MTDNTKSRGGEADGQCEVVRGGDGHGDQPQHREWMMLKYKDLDPNTVIADQERYNSGRISPNNNQFEMYIL